MVPLKQLCSPRHGGRGGKNNGPGKRLPSLTGNFDNQNNSGSNCNAMQWWKQKLWMQFSKRLTLMKLLGKERFSLEKSNVIFDKWNQPSSQSVFYSCDASEKWRCNFPKDQLCCTFRVEHHGWPFWPVSVSSAKCNIRPEIWITSSTCKLPGFFLFFASCLDFFFFLHVAWIFSFFLQVAWIFSFFASCLDFFFFCKLPVYLFFLQVAWISSFFASCLAFFSFLQVAWMGNVSPGILYHNQLGEEEVWTRIWGKPFNFYFLPFPKP